MLIPQPSYIGNNKMVIPLPVKKKVKEVTIKTRFLPKKYKKRVRKKNHVMRNETSRKGIIIPANVRIIKW